MPLRRRIKMPGDVSATGLAAPANSSGRRSSSAGDPHFLAAMGGPVMDVLGAANRAAMFGPAGTPAFSIQCQKQREGPNQLIFIRYMTPNAGGNTTLSFTGNGQAASVPIET